MGSAKTFKKQRKYARQEALKVYDKFSKEFDPEELLKPCPWFIPQIVWNILIWIVIKK